jgi:hypothetical protein
MAPVVMALFPTIIMGIKALDLDTDLGAMHQLNLNMVIPLLVGHTMLHLQITRHLPTLLPLQEDMDPLNLNMVIHVHHTKHHRQVIINSHSHTHLLDRATSRHPTQLPLLEDMDPLNLNMVIPLLVALIRPQYGVDTVRRKMRTTKKILTKIP